MPLQVTPRGLSKVAKDSSHFSIWKEGKNPKEQMEKSWESPAQVPASRKTLKDFFFSFICMYYFKEKSET